MQLATTLLLFPERADGECVRSADDPSRTHAVALVVVKSFEAPFQRVDVVSFGRVAKMVKKQLYFAAVRQLSPTQAEPRSDVVFVSLTHALLASRQEEDAEEEEEEEEG
jgi:hypothetical protein